MMIKFNLSIIRTFIGLGVIWLCLGFGIPLFDPNVTSITSGLSLLGLIYLAKALWEWQLGYLIIKNERIIKRSLKPRSIHYSKINKIAIDNGDILLKSRDYELKRGTDKMDYSSRQKLDEALKPIKNRLNTTVRS